MAPATEDRTSRGGNRLAVTTTHEPSDSTVEWVRLDVDNGQPGNILELFPPEDAAPIGNTSDAEPRIASELSGAAQLAVHSVPSPVPVDEHAFIAATLPTVRSRKQHLHPSFKTLGVIASGFVLGFVSFRLGATRPPRTSQAAGATTERPSIHRDANRLIPPEPADGGMRLTSASKHQGETVDSAATDPAGGVAPPAESTARAPENPAATSTTAPPNNARPPKSIAARSAATPLPAGRNTTSVNQIRTTTDRRDVEANPEGKRLELPVDGSAFSPSFAASESALFFHAGRSPESRLLKADLDGDDTLRIVTVLSDGMKNYHPRISPDDRLVAFDSDRDGERGVYIAKRDGTDVRRVSGDGFAAVPTWSPDSKWLAFVRGEPGRPNVWNLWLRDMTSGELTRLTSFKFGQTWAASWFPDSRRVCYSHEDQLTILDIATGASESFRSPRKTLVRTPAVSPEGQRVIFQVYKDGVWLLDLRTRAMRQIFADPTAEEFAWDPTGSRVAYHSRRDGEWRIWVTAPPS
jgi:hypothetical protein